VVNVIRYAESGQDLLKGKAYLILSILLERSENAVSIAFRQRIISLVDKDLERICLGDQSDQEEQDYCLTAIVFLCRTLEKALPALASGLSDGLLLVSGRKHPSAAQVKVIKSRLQAYPSLLAASQSRYLREMVINASILEQLSRLTKHMPGALNGDLSLSEIDSSATSDFLDTTFSLLDLLVSSPILVQCWSTVAEKIIPPVFSMSLTTNASYASYPIRSLRFVGDALAGIYKWSSQTTSGQSELESIQSLLSAFFEDSLFRAMPLLLDGPHPIPSLACALFLSFLRLVPSAIDRSIRANLVAQLVTLLWTNQNDGVEFYHSEHVMSVLKDICKSNEVNVRALLATGLLSRLLEALSQNTSMGERQESGITVILETIFHILRNVADLARRALKTQQQPSASQAKSISEAAEYSLRLAMEVTDGIEALASLLSDIDLAVALNAVRILTLVTQLYPKSVANLFQPASLGAISAALDADRPHIHQLVLKLLLRSLASSTASIAALKGSKAVCRVLHALGQSQDTRRSNLSTVDLSASLRAVATSVKDTTQQLAQEILAVLERKS
jgi:hypothetical protein